MNIITKDIKTIKDLRKYVNSIDWYNKEWNEKDNEQFAHKLIVQRRNKEERRSPSRIHGNGGRCPAADGLRVGFLRSLQPPPANQTMRRRPGPNGPIRTCLKKRKR